MYKYRGQINNENLMDVLIKLVFEYNLMLFMMIWHYSNNNNALIENYKKILLPRFWYNNIKNALTDI